MRHSPLLKELNTVLALAKLLFFISFAHLYQSYGKELLVLVFLSYHINQDLAILSVYSCI